MEANNGILVHMETDSETNPSVSIFYPQVIGELTPFQGQQFETLEEVYDFYNQYAREAGFSVRSYSSKKSKDGEVIRKEYVCNKEGSWSTETSGAVKRRRGVGRESCKARLIVVKSKYGGYVVTIFEEAHTHPMTTPRRRHLLKSHRRISGVDQLVTQQLISVNVSTHQQYDILATQAGGIENVGFTQQDMYNSNRDRRMKIKGHDGEMLFDHFMNEQEKNPGFIFKVETNIEHNITRCFWADAISRQSYKFYGDAVIFDTTYNTNRYCMIFAPIMGVNNHGQTIIFSGAFLSDETADSFIWLFREFFRAMPGDAPKIIITDQDPAMTKAISEALPNTFHRTTNYVQNGHGMRVTTSQMQLHYVW
ncbi:protein FAR1-RELATED SEQUENCE 5-like [Prunus avium]|uniref:Protein FAR1-RELATED SEQUENCE 5-like n=1 Tax=Prunus avium TaxID=42229 RepID=A0A6P5SU11_PRUAV|nr:protein FAR1-RELATED SEQUENCE 5-like [Prunus avium]